MRARARATLFTFLGKDATFAPALQMPEEALPLPPPRMDVGRPHHSIVSIGFFFLATMKRQTLVDARRTMLYPEVDERWLRGIGP